MITPQELKLIIRKRKISQEEMAKHLGIARVSLNRFLNGRTEVTYSLYMKLIEKLGGVIVMSEKEDIK